MYYPEWDTPICHHVHRQTRCADMDSLEEQFLHSASYPGCMWQHKYRWFLGPLISSRERKRGTGPLSFTGELVFRNRDLGISAPFLEFSASSGGIIHSILGLALIHKCNEKAHRISLPIFLSLHVSPASYFAVGSILKNKAPYSTEQICRP